MFKSKTKTHSIKVLGSHLDIYNEHKRLFKFCSWENSKGVLKDYISKKVLEENPKLGSKDNFDVVMQSVNPMRKTRFGNFYLDVKGKLLDSSGEYIGELSEFNISHIHLDGYICHDEEENSKRKEKEKNFGNSQFEKELSIRLQALDSMLEKSGGKITLDLEDIDSLDKFVVNFMTSTGWDKNLDNRLHSRIKRLPSHMIIPS